VTVPPGAVFDAGQILCEETPKIEHQFNVVNTTGRSVTIQGERHSCDCTQVRYDRERLAAGDSMPLTMVVRVPGGHAVMKPSCTLQTDNPDFPEWTYEIQFESFPQISFAPERIELGTTELMQAGLPGSMGVRADGSIEYCTRDGQAAPPLPVITAPEGLKAEVGLPAVERVGPKLKKYRYPLRVAHDGSPERAGRHSPLLWARFGELSPRSATIAWRVTAPIEFAPAQIHFGVVGPDEPDRRQTVTLRSTNGEPFRVVEFDGVVAGASVHLPGESALPTAPYASHELEVEFALDPNINARSASGTIRVWTDHPALPAVELPWSAFVRRAEGRAATD
jgi:Protein of unknown function (DUF1573)